MGERDRNPDREDGAARRDPTAPADAAKTDPLATTAAATPSGEAAASEAPKRRRRQPSEPQLQPGDMLGRYRIEAIIGGGGMGVVYAAFDPELDRRLALKLVRLPHNDEHSVRLQREARVMARLSHPNVVPVYDVGRAGEKVFVAMELVDGDSASDWLAEHRSWREALDVMVPAGRGLAAAHDAGIVHRDFKPSNVLVGRDGTVRVTDFGVARVDDSPAEPSGRRTTDPAGGSGSLTRTGALMGTPAYMAPEQHLGGDVDARSDQFSFCVTLWEAVYRQPPYATTDAPSIKELAADVVAGRLRPVPPGSPVPAWLRRIMLRGLATDPAERWPSMQDLLREIERAPRWRRRGVAVAIGAVVAAGTAVALTRSPTPSPSAAPPETVAAPLIESSTLRRLTFADGCEEYPAFSADGSTVYYDAANGPDYRLHTVSLETGETKEITSVHGWDLAAAPSPDGRRIAFVRQSASPMSTYLAELDDLAHPRVLLDGGSFRPTWSADGKHVWAGNNDELFRYDVASGQPVRSVTSPRNHRPMLGFELEDGTLVVLVRPSNNAVTADGIVAYPADGGPMRWLLDDDILEEILALAPGGHSVLAARITPADQIEVLRVPLTGGAPVPVPGNGVVARKRLVISPDGRRMVWSDCQERNNLAVLDFATDPARLVDLTQGAWSDAAPVSIPGTDDLLFLSDRDDRTKVWRTSRNQRGPVRLVPFGDVEPVSLAVSADGRLLAAAEGDLGLYIAPIDGGSAPRKLSDEPGDLHPSFDRHGRLVYFQRRDGDAQRIASVSVDGGPPTWVLPPGSALPAASPTDDLLAYVARSTNGSDSQVVPMLLDLRDGSTRPILAAPPDALYSFIRWSPDGKRLLLIPRMTELIEVEVGTGTVLRRFAPGADAFAGATYLSDEIIVARAGWNGDLWTAEVAGAADPAPPR